MQTSTYELIDKEKIENLKFPANEVLQDMNQIRERREDLQKALSLGNLDHAKIQIFFEDEHSKKVVETTVWGVTDKRVILKQGVVIPIHRVHSVRI